MADLTDEDLMIMFREGDTEAFEALFSRHHASVYNFARTMLRDPHRAEDVLQETFLSVARAAGRYEPRGYFRTWLMRICRNRCINQIKAERLHRAAIAETDLDIVDPASEDPPPHERVEAAERATAVRRQIARLPERQAEAIALYAFEHMSYQEISEVMEVPVGTVKTLIHRARATLAEAMEHAGRTNDGM